MPSPTPSVSPKQCAFDLSSDLGYTLPEPAVPEGYTAELPETALLRGGPTALRLHVGACGRTPG